MAPGVENRAMKRMRCQRLTTICVGGDGSAGQKEDFDGWEQEWLIRLRSSSRSR